MGGGGAPSVAEEPLRRREVTGFNHEIRTRRCCTGFLEVAAFQDERPSYRWSPNMRTCVVVHVVDGGCPSVICDDAARAERHTQPANPSAVSPTRPRFKSRRFCGWASPSSSRNTSACSEVAGRGRPPSGTGTQRDRYANDSEPHTGHIASRCTSSQSRHSRASRSFIEISIGRLHVVQAVNGVSGPSCRIS